MIGPDSYRRLVADTRSARSIAGSVWRCFPRDSERAPASSGRFTSGSVRLAIRLGCPIRAVHHRRRVRVQPQRELVDAAVHDRRSLARHDRDERADAGGCRGAYDADASRSFQVQSSGRGRKFRFGRRRADELGDDSRRSRCRSGARRSAARRAHRQSVEQSKFQRPNANSRLCITLRLIR
jgi:hypothetical protein